MWRENLVFPLLVIVVIVIGRIPSEQCHGIVTARTVRLVLVMVVLDRKSVV